MTRWIGLACALIVLTGAATFVYQILPDPVPDPKIELHPRADGPPPKLEIVGEKVHNFGSTTVHAKGSHTWRFKNVGQGPLEVWLEKTSCSCTVAELKSAEGEPKKKVTIPPGGSSPLEVTWEGRKSQPRFGQVATVGTNDPDSPSVDLSVVGKIVDAVEVDPSESVNFAEISAEEPQRRTVAIVSTDRPDLKLTKLKSSRPDLIVADAKPMGPEELKRRNARSGYEVTVEVKPGMPPGRFSEKVMVETDHPERPELDLAVVGQAYGPISVVPSRLVMPRVASRRGGSQAVELIVRGADRTQFEVASKPDKIRVAIAPEETPGVKGRYRLTVTVPPDTAPGVLDDPIVLKTDHPRIREVKIPIQIYVSSRSEAG
jgi:uncharacterized protein DUF1573